MPLSTHILFGLWLDSYNIFWKALVIVVPFLSFTGITYASLLKIPMAHNEQLILLLNLLINCISARLKHQILSIKGECTFLLLNFLIADLCNCSANSLFEIF